MKQANVVVGSTYSTYIGAERCNVVVVGVVGADKDSHFSSDRRMRFRVKRVGKDECLPKLRSAAALQEI